MATLRAPLRLLAAARAHLSLIGQAPLRAWFWFFSCWFVLFVFLAGMLLYTDLTRQQEHFKQESQELVHGIQTRLNNSELVLYGMEDIIDEEATDHLQSLRNYAKEAERRYHFIYSMGFQPRIQPYQRPQFEQQQTSRLGRPFVITDQPEHLAGVWQPPIKVRRAPNRNAYIPLAMLEPALTPDLQPLLGLDLLANPRLGPAVERALGSSQIEISPIIRLPGQRALIACIQAIYTEQQPPSSLILRPEEATGIALLLLRADSLIDLSIPQRQHLTVSLTRQQDASSLADALIYQHPAGTPATGLARWLSPMQLELPIASPWFPYALRIERTPELGVDAQHTLLLLLLVALIPSYLILLIAAIRHHAQKASEFADDSLYRTREHATVTLQAISDAVITMDTDCLVQYLNPAATRHLDIRLAQAIGQPVSEVFRLRYEFARQAIADPFERCLRQHQLCELAENSYLLRSNGEKLLIEGSISPLFDRNGGLIGAVLTFRDTAPLRRRMLEALEASEARLRQHEYELARVTRITSMGEMASGIAHEINQPLAAIMSYCQASQNLLADDEPDLALVTRTIGAAVAQADRAGQIVKRLREFVSKGDRRLTPVDINHAVTNVLTLAEYDLRQQNITVSYFPGAALPLVYADSIQLEQVILNLVRNAMDAMQQQDTVRTLHVETSQRDERVCIRVGDNGPGISESQIDNLFAPFFSTKSNGMGLGLTICQTIIESFAGVIHVHNRSAGGAEFTVELPPMTTEKSVFEPGIVQ